MSVQKSITAAVLFVTLCLFFPNQSIANLQPSLDCESVAIIVDGTLPNEFVYFYCTILDDNIPVGLNDAPTDLEQNLSEDEVMYLHAIDDAGFADEVRRHLLWLMLLWGGSL